MSLLASADTAIVSTLVDAGADVNARVKERNPLVAARLLELGADPNARSISGMMADPVSCQHWNTPVFFAIATAEQVSGCLAAGADIHARTERYHFDVRRGSSPLHVAGLKQHPDHAARENGALQGLEVVMRLRGAPVRLPPPGPSSAGGA